MTPRSACQWFGGPGQRVAFDDNVPVAGSRAGHPTAALGMVDASGGRVTMVYRSSQPTALQLAGWWPGGGGLLFWIDTANSASLEATGLSLYSLATGSSVPVKIATGLAGQQWLARSPAGPTVAIVAGGGRTLWSPGRVVDRCTFPSGVCQKMAMPSGSVGLAPAWTPSGGLLYVVAAAAAPGGLSGYSPSSIAKQESTSRLYYLAPGSHAARPQVSPGKSIVAAQVAATGKGVLIVRRNGLWLASLTSSSRPVRIAAPLYSAAAPSGYYGEVDWTGTFAWSKGIGGSGGGGSSTAFYDSLSGPSPELP